MEQSAKEAWKRLLEEARRELPEATVRTWLEPAVPLALEDGRLVLGAPDQFAAEWNDIETRAVARACRGARVRPADAGGVPGAGGPAAAAADGFLRRAAEADAPSTAPSVATTPLNERYTFESFVIGKSNELAAAAAHAVAEAPGKTYNPLFIYGATGLGKTHLMQAIAHAVLQRKPETRMPYIGAEQFINEVIESIQARTMPEFRRRYRNDSISSWWTTCISWKARK